MEERARWAAAGEEPWRAAPGLGAGSPALPQLQPVRAGGPAGYESAGGEVAASSLWQLQGKGRDFPLLVPTWRECPKRAEEPRGWVVGALSPVQWGGAPTFTDTQQQVRIRLCSSDSRTESSSSSCPRPFPSMMREPMAFPMSANDGAAAAKGRSVV